MIKYEILDRDNITVLEGTFHSLGDLRKDVEYIVDLAAEIDHKYIHLTNLSNNQTTVITLREQT